MKRMVALPTHLKVLETLHYLLAFLALIGLCFAISSALIVDIYWIAVVYFGFLCPSLFIAGISIGKRKHLFYLQQFELLLVYLVPVVGTAVGIYAMIALYHPDTWELFEKRQTLTQNNSQ